MPSIDFYFINAKGGEAGLLFACRLLEKAYSQKHQIYVHLENAEKARFLDNLLWTFREESFVPHSLYDPAKPVAAPIQLGYGDQAAPHGDILLNLHPEVPDFHSRFKRVLEVLPKDPEAVALAELHRNFYERLGYPLNQHQINQ